MERQTQDDEYDSKVITCSSLVPCSQLPESEDVQHTHTEGIDRLSVLPKCILKNVLLPKLTTRDVFLMSLVSHHFKYQSSSLTRLEFDKVNLLIAANQDDHPNNCCCDFYKEKFLHCANQFLRFHQGTKLERFALDFCLGVDDKDDIDRWIRIVIAKDVEKLKLNFLCHDQRIKSSCKEKPTRRRFNHKKYVLSRDLLGGLNKLKWLYLIGCKIDRGLLADFINLTTLDLAYMDLSRCDLQSKLQFMPNLKNFVAKKVFFPMKLSFGCLPLLEVIDFDHCYGVDEVELCNAALKRFFTNFHSVVKCNLSGISSKLISLGINADENGLNYIFTQLAVDQPWLKSLSIFSLAHWGSCIPEGISKFSHLKDLKIYMWQNTTFDIYKLINVLRVSPLLCTMKLMTNCSEDVQLSMPELSEHVHQCLERVRIWGTFSTSSQIEFIVYVLKSSPALKQLIIEKKVETRNLVMGRVPWDQGQREHIHERIQDALDGDHIVDVVLKP